MGSPIDLRLGRWQEVLQDVESFDCLITDPPYSERTHIGALSCSGESGVNGYSFWTEKDVNDFVDYWSPRCKSWMVIHTDDQLHPIFRKKLDLVGRCTFTILPVLQHHPRLSGDGPGSPGHFLCVSRPRESRFSQWGSLPGWYECRRDGSIVRGGKPLSLLRAIIRDYTNPGDLIVDPCAGGATTLIASAMEGRRAIGAEMDPKTYRKAKRRIEGGYTTNLPGIE